MSNLLTYKATKIRERIKSIGVQFSFLFSYSLNLNLIENCWLKTKEYLRSQESQNSLGFSQAIDLVTDEDIINWFTHSYYRRLPN